MEKQSTKRGLNLYRWASRSLTASEISIQVSTDSLELLVEHAADLDWLILEGIAVEFSFATSWLFIAPAFFHVSIIVSWEVLFPWVPEFFDDFEDFLSFLLLLWKDAWFVLICSVIFWIRAGWPEEKVEDSSGKDKGHSLRILFNKLSRNLHHKRKLNQISWN